MWLNGADHPVRCVNFESSGTVTLGNGLEDEVVINGHIRQSDLIFDANSDGNMLTLHFEDPTSSQIITFPDETGTVLTTTTSAFVSAQQTWTIL